MVANQPEFKAGLDNIYEKAVRAFVKKFGLSRLQCDVRKPDGSVVEVFRFALAGFYKVVCTRVCFIASSAAAKEVGLAHMHEALKAVGWPVFGQM